jgi:hypothetical protein
MTIRLSNGSVVSIASTYGSPITVSAVTNANPGVATATAHGLANGDIIEVTSGWPGLNSKIVRVSGVTANNFNFEGIDTTSTTNFPAGAGIGTVRKVTAWAALQQILNFESSGGDQNYWEYQFLESDTQRRLKTFKSPQAINLSIGDDPTLPGYIVLAAANDDGLPRALRVALPGGSFLYYNMDISVNKTPQVTVNQGTQVSAVLSLLADVVRY